LSFPAHIARVLDDFRVPADTKAALFDLYVSMGDEVLEVFSDVAEGIASASLLTPDDTLTIREQLVERYLTRNHPRWREGIPTPSLWHPRELEGRASGLVVPLDDSALHEIVRRVVGDAQPVPEGILLLGRNAHYGGRADTISFDVVASSLEDAIALGKAAGQQHTIPGSAGETSGTLDAIRSIALIWEVQPNVYKPSADRNRAIAKVHRKHRNWHVATLAAALQWLRAQKAMTFILRGDALAATHEVNPDKPVSDTIAANHDRTVADVARAMSLTLADPTNDEEFLLLESSVMNHALRKHVLRAGAAGAMWRVVW
jgi:hypothetical protein